jgi:hypothetical protein
MTETPETEASGFGISRMPYVIGLDMPAVFTNALVSLGRKTAFYEKVHNVKADVAAVLV